MDTRYPKYGLIIIWIIILSVIVFAGIKTPDILKVRYVTPVQYDQKDYQQIFDDMSLRMQLLEDEIRVLQNEGG